MSLSTMMQIAVDVHRHQVDKGGQPYILHPLYVMHQLRHEDLITQQMAVGHDIIEDSKGKVTPEFLRVLDIQEEVIDGIVLLSRKPGQTELEYCNGIETNMRAMKVKIEDLKHNMDITRLVNGLHQRDYERLIRYKEMYLQLTEQVRRLTR